MERVRGAYAAWNEGELETLIPFFHREIEFVTSGTFPGLDHVYRGHDGFTRFWRDFPETFEAILISVDELRDCGGCVLALVSFEARGRDGLEVGRPMNSVWSFRDGLVIRIENYDDRAEAVEAAGAEDPVSRD